jgi:hypothetical protein
MAAKSISNPAWIQGSNQQERIANAQAQGFIVEQSLPNGDVQMVKKKKFSFLIFLLLLFTVGGWLLYVIYFVFVKKDTYIILPKSAKQAAK